MIDSPSAPLAQPVTRRRRRRQRALSGVDAGSRLNPDGAAQRSTLRSLGLGCFGVGALFVAIGLIDFFSSMGSMHSPTLFWCLFVGVPLASVGTFMLKAGYLGVAARYVAGEVSPVASDALGYALDRNQGPLRRVARALRGGGGDRAAAGAFGPSAGAAGSAAGAVGAEDDTTSVRARLERLDSLRRDGLIDADDFAAQKQRILGDL